jgi:hypothetical protein
MFAGGILGLLLLVVLFVLLLGMALVVVLMTSSRPEALMSSELAAARRHAVTTSGLSLTLLLAAPVVLVVGMAATTAVGGLSSVVPTISTVACAPLLGALLALLALLLGEATWPRPTGTSRTALLHDRSVRALLGRGWPSWGGVTVLVTAALLVGAGLLGDASGGSVTHVRADGTDTAGPFPGWTYAGPQLVALAVCVLVAAATVRSAARRSAVVTADVETDMLLRRASVARVSRALVAATLMTLGPDLLLGGMAVRNAFAGTGWQTVGSVAALAGPLLGLLGLVALLVPVPRLTATPLYGAPVTPPAAPGLTA